MGEGQREIAGELKRGTMLLACRHHQRLASQIMNFSAQRAALEFPGPVTPPFRAAEELQLNYWHDRDTLHTFQAEVIRVTGYGRQIETLLRDHTVERRKHPRFEIPVPVSAAVSQAQKESLVGTCFVAETKNISLSGLLIETPLSLSLGDQLELELELASDERLDTSAWVVRSKMVRREEFVGAVVIKSSNSLSLEFQSLQSDQQRRLFQFLLRQRVHDTPVPSEATSPA